MDFGSIFHKYHSQFVCFPLYWRLSFCLFVVVFLHRNQCLLMALGLSLFLFLFRCHLFTHLGFLSSVHDCGTCIAFSVPTLFLQQVTDVLFVLRLILLETAGKWDWESSLMGGAEVPGGSMSCLFHNVTGHLSPGSFVHAVG